MDRTNQSTTDHNNDNDEEYTSNEKKVQTVDGSTNIIKTNNYLSPQIIQHKGTRPYSDGKPCPSLVLTQKVSNVQRLSHSHN